MMRYSSRVMVARELYIGENYNTNSLETCEGFAESFVVIPERRYAGSTCEIWLLQDKRWQYRNIHSQVDGDRKNE